MSSNGNCTSSLTSYSKMLVDKYIFFPPHVTWLKNAPSTMCITHLHLLSYLLCIEVAAENSTVSLLKPIGLVIHLETMKTGTVLTIFLSYVDGTVPSVKGFLSSSSTCSVLLQVSVSRKKISK